MKLSDTQSILLSTAAQRDSGSLYPLPDTPSLKAGATKSITTLLKHGFAEERETLDATAVSRTDGDVRYGMFVTAAGLAAIGLGEDESSPTVDTLPTPPSPRTTKSASVLALLGRETGATLPELIEATGWLPHTTRAALTGLRKKGTR